MQPLPRRIKYEDNNLFPDETENISIHERGDIWQKTELCVPLFEEIYDQAYIIHEDEAKENLSSDYNDAINVYMINWRKTTEGIETNIDKWMSAW